MSNEKARKFYMSKKWGNPNWDRNTHTMFGKSEMLDFAQAYADQELRSYIKRIVSHINHELEEIENMINDGGVGQQYWINKKGSWNEFYELIIDEHPKIKYSNAKN